MRNVRRYALAALVAVLCSTGVASAAPADDPGGSNFFSRIKHRIIQILDDVRMGFPGT